jgi:hypothetical protein
MSAAASMPARTATSASDTAVASAALAEVHAAAASIASAGGVGASFFADTACCGVCLQPLSEGTRAGSSSVGGADDNPDAAAAPLAWVEQSSGAGGAVVRPGGATFSGKAGSAYHACCANLWLSTGSGGSVAVPLPSGSARTLELQSAAATAVP